MVHYLDTSKHNARSNGANAGQKERYRDLQQYGAPFLLLNARSIQCQFLLRAAIDASNAAGICCQRARSNATCSIARSATAAAASTAAAAAARRTRIWFGGCYGRRDD